MPDSLVVVGQICVAVFPEDSNWHRVTITGIRDNSFVDVSENKLCPLFLIFDV